MAAGKTLFKIYIRLLTGAGAQEQELKFEQQEVGRTTANRNVC